jgi:hypothetical protein
MDEQPLQIRRHAEELPNPSLPAFQHITPRPFTVEFVERKFRTAGGGSGGGGAFFTTYTITAEGATQGDTMLQGGTVTGGNGGSATVADYKVLDPDTGVGSLEGDILYLQVAATATIEDGLMMPGCTITTATLETAATVPDNHTFTVAAPSGNLYFEVGRWNADTFLPSGPPGNLLASGCIGNFSLAKVT